MPEINYLLTSILIILAWIFDTLKDEVEYHYETSRFRNISFFKANWKNRYSNLDTLKVKWWAWIVPAAIDGPHLFAFLKRFAWLNAVYAAGFYKLQGLSWSGYFGYLVIFWAIRRIEHYIILHGNEK